MGAGYLCLEKLSFKHWVVAPTLFVVTRQSSVGEWSAVAIGTVTLLFAHVKLAQKSEAHLKQSLL